MEKQNKEQVIVEKASRLNYVAQLFPDLSAIQHIEIAERMEKQSKQGLSFIRGCETRLNYPL